MAVNGRSAKDRDALSAPNAKHGSTYQRDLDAAHGANQRAQDAADAASAAKSNTWAELSVDQRGAYGSGVTVPAKTDDPFDRLGKASRG